MNFTPNLFSPIIIPDNRENYIWSCSSPSLKKHNYVLGRPIEISAGETFKVTINAPPGFVLDCICESKSLFEHGCRCGAFMAQYLR